MSYAVVATFKAQAGTTGSTLTLVTPNVVLPAGTDVVLETTRTTATGNVNGVSAIGGIGGATWSINRASSSRASTYDVALHTIRLASDVAPNTSFVVTFRTSGGRRSAVASCYSGLTGAVEATTGNLSDTTDGGISTGQNGASTATPSFTMPATTTPESLLIGGYGLGGAGEVAAAAGAWTTDDWINTAVGSGDRGSLLMHQRVTSAGTYTVDATANPASSWAGVAISMPIAATAAGYAATVTAQAPVSYWRLDEASGATTATDAQGAHDLTIGTGATLAQEGALAGDPSTSFYFNGASDVLVNPAMGAAPSFSLVGFVKQDTAVPSTYHTSMAGLEIVAGDTTQPHILFVTRRNATGNKLALWDTVNTWRESNVALPLNQWVHVAFVVTSTTVTFYVNGVNQGSVAGSAMNAGPYPQLNIGASTSLGANSMKGWLDEVAFFNKALTAANVTSLYQAWLNGTTGSGGTGTHGAPVVVTNGDQTGLDAGETAYLTGTGTTTPGGTLASALWTPVGAPATSVTLDPGTGLNRSYRTPPHLTGTSYTWRLTVTDELGQTASKDVVHTSNPATRRLCRGGVAVPVARFKVSST